MKLARDIGLIFLLALLWFGPAYYAGEALIPSWGLQCGLVGLITGLIGLAIVNRTEEGRRLFYEGESEEEGLNCLKLLVICLIGFPITLLFLGTIWWLMRLLGFFDLE
jgi:hypothetical protein